jgi:hypothetical protein
MLLPTPGTRRQAMGSRSHAVEGLASARATGRTGRSSGFLLFSIRKAHPSKSFRSAKINLRNIATPERCPPEDRHRSFWLTLRNMFLPSSLILLKLVCGIVWRLRVRQLNHSNCRRQPEYNRCSTVAHHCTFANDRTIACGRSIAQCYERVVVRGI